MQLKKPVTASVEMTGDVWQVSNRETPTGLLWGTRRDLRRCPCSKCKWLECPDLLRQVAMNNDWSRKKREKIVDLVGERCVVNGTLNGIDSELLWDTGSAVSLVSDSWVKCHLPHAEIRPVEELLEGQHLDLKAANEIEMPYLGWILVDLRIGTKSLGVPMLVYPGSMKSPLIGYNVIEHLMGNCQKGSKISTLVQAIPGKKKQDVEALVRLIEAGMDEDTVDVQTSNLYTLIPPREWRDVECITKCQLNHQRVMGGTEGVFVPTPATSVPEGLLIPETVVKMPQRRVLCYQFSTLLTMTYSCQDVRYRKH
ncbi:hypothetical protein BSL78_07256 [Apostichopus japonicus]|uniref:Uncharacterized protein n=1 Tax=Stichopus japonicus TaxID=307972 RepID=A0A2G8L6D6_STIJA|nr:hypothetical protein BSL78_07256 [Apostichopus japonicus]